MEGVSWVLVWVDFALGVIVSVGLLALCRKRYRGNLRAMLGGVVGALGATCAFSLVLAQVTGFAVIDSVIVIGALVAGAAVLGGVLYAEIRRVRGPRGTRSLAEDIRVE